MELAFLVPADLPGPSGGGNYNQALIDHLAAPGHRVRVIRIPGSWPRPEPAHRRALASAIASSSTALVDGIMALAAPEVLAAAQKTKTAVHILLHSCLSADVALDSAEMRKFAASERSAMQAARSVICTSHWAARDVHARHPIARPEVVSPGTSPAGVAQGSSPLQLLFLAALSPVKNQMLVLNGLASVAELPWTASLVGSPAVAPKYARMLRSTADRYFEPGRINFAGVRTGPDLEEIWNRTDLLLLTSVTETFGLVVTEALARGIPAVVSAGTGAVEALLGADSDRPRSVIDRPGIPGAIVDPDDAAALSNTLREWLEQPARRAHWRASALERRDSLRSWNEAAAAMWEILDR